MIKIDYIIEKLQELYPEPKILLRFSTVFQLAVATILSAQCTDKQVNKITPALFQQFPDSEQLAKANIEEIENLIRSTGFYHNKSKNILNLAKKIHSEYNGIVPDTIAELVKLPGIGRKSANVIAGTWYKKPSVVVDTHFRRVSQRLGLTKQNNPEKIEYEIKNMVPSLKQTRFSFLLNYHGRYLCKARKPLCQECPLKGICTFYCNLV